MKCSDCGREIINDSEFCPHCGKKVMNTNVSRYANKQAEKVSKIFTLVILGLSVGFWAFALYEWLDNPIFAQCYIYLISIAIMLVACLIVFFAFVKNKEVKSKIKIEYFSVYISLLFIISSIVSLFKCYLHQHSLGAKDLRLISVIVIIALTVTALITFVIPQEFWNKFHKSSGKKANLNLIDCSVCGKTIPDDSEFCPYCRSKIEKPEFCRKCGGRLLEDSDFCHICGEKVFKPEEQK